MTRVLVVKLSAMGDLFHALPAVHNLKVGLDAEIDWVVHAEYVELARCFTDVRRVIPFFRRSFFRDLRGFLVDLRREKYDCIVDLQGLLKSALVTRLARGRRRIGPSFAREGARMFYSEVSGRRRGDRHAVEQNLDVVAHLGLTRLAPRFPVTFLAQACDGLRPRVAIVPCSRWPSKNWPAACFAETASRILSVRGGSLYLLGGEADRAACDAIAAAAGRQAVNLAGRTRLPQMGGMLREMDLVIANDSGPVHMAAAVGTPTLVVFGPTDPARTGPFGPGHRVLTADVACRPCYSRMCRQEGIPCLAGVTPERVVEEALRMLEGGSVPP